MIHTLTLNPSLDYIAECPHFTLSATNRTTGETIYPGGKGINVSLVLKNLGYSSITHGFIAGFTGQALVSLLEQTGLQTDMISVSGKMRYKVGVLYGAMRYWKKIHC